MIGCQPDKHAMTPVVTAAQALVTLWERNGVTIIAEGPASDLTRATKLYNLIHVMPPQPDGEANAE